MQSIALFPCLYTDEAGIIGELANSLHLRVYTDEMLFSESSEQFGISVEQLKKILYGITPELNRCNLEKDKYIDLIRCSLEARRTLSPGRYIYYGLHTSLLDAKHERVMKVLVIDEEESRVQRAMQQEGFSEGAARDTILQHDEKVSGWTQYLFNKKADSPSLHDLVISIKNRRLLDITTLIIQSYYAFEYSLDPVQRTSDLHVPDSPL